MVPCISKLLPDIALADFIIDPDIIPVVLSVAPVMPLVAASVVEVTPVAITFVNNASLPVISCPEIFPTIEIVPEPDIVLVLRSKLPPSCGVVSLTTLVVFASDPVLIVTAKVAPPPLVNVITLFVAEAVVNRLAVAAFTDPDMSDPNCMDEDTNVGLPVNPPNGAMSAFTA